MDDRIQQARLLAVEIRIQTIRAMAIAGGGHIGGAMSMSDLVSVLYSGELRCDPKNPGWEDRDRLVCSKGHSGPAIYAALALKGFFPSDWLETLNKPGTHLPSHVDRNKTPGIDVCTGSLGQGLSVACGLAMAFRQDHRENRVFAILGDGECQEGQIWEAAMFAGHYHLDHLIAFVDANKGQLDGTTKDVMTVEPLEERFSAFGWSVQRVNGQDVAAIFDAIHKAKDHTGSPSVIVLDTVKGSGCSFALNVPNHHMYVTQEQAAEAIEALNAEKLRILEQ